MSESGQSFDKTLQRFVEENKLEALDRELLTQDELKPARTTSYGYAMSITDSSAMMKKEQLSQAREAFEAQARGDRAAMAIDLLAIRTSERQAESQDRHARAMKWLTIALFVVAAFEAAGTVMAALIELGVIGR